MSRPGTGLGALSVSGSTPPTRAGVKTSVCRTGSRAAGESPLDVLTHALIKKMREKFGDVARDVTSQEIIAKEVTTFMTNIGSVRENDLGQLEERIRCRLSGETPKSNTLASMKRAQQAGDEWARIFALQIQEGKELSANAKADAAVKNDAIKAQLARQLADRARAEQQEKQEEMDYAKLEQEQLKEWEAAEAHKKQLAREIALKLKEDRAAQLADRDLRKRLAETKKAAEERELAARLAYEARTEAEEEEAQRLAAKAALKAFLLNNEALKVIKEQAKQQQWAADKAIMEEWAAQQERHEAARKAQLEKLKAWQAAQEREAATRPEAKRWIDPAIIERYTREADAAAAAEEERRQNALKASKGILAASLGQQVKEQEALKHAHDDEEQAAIRALMAGVRAEQERREREAAAEAAKKAELKAALEQQMRQNAVRKIVAPMSETEKLLNKQLLEKVQKAGLGMTSTQQQQLNQQLGSGCIRTATASKRAQKC